MYRKKKQNENKEQAAFAAATHKLFIVAQVDRGNLIHANFLHAEYSYTYTYVEINNNVVVVCNVPK